MAISQAKWFFRICAIQSAIFGAYQLFGASAYLTAAGIDSKQITTHAIIDIR